MMHVQNNNKKPFVPETLEDLVEFISMNMHLKISTIDKKTGKAICLGINQSYDIGFITDITYKIYNGKNLSERQAQVIWKIVKKYLDFIIACNVDVDALLKLVENPKYRKPLYQSVIIPREIRYIADYKFAVRFNFNPTIRNDLQLSVVECRWNEQNKFWVVAVNKSTCVSFKRFINRYKFVLDNVALKMLNYMISFQHGYEIGEKNNRVFVNIADNQVLYNLMHMIWQENYETF